MRDAVLIVGGGLLQMPAIEIAKKMGLATIVTDANPDAPGMKIADEAAVVNIYDVPRHIILAEKSAKRYNLLGVFAEGADVEVTVASTAAHMRLPGILPQAALCCKNKAMMRKVFDEKNISNPRWTEVDNINDLKKAVKRIGYPYIIKAVDNCGSRGATKVLNNKMDLTKALADARANSTTNTALIEECFSGPEQSVEILFDKNGKCYHLNIVDRPFTEGQWAVELGHINPTSLVADKQLELFKLAELAAQVVGVNFGAFKIDTIWTKEGPCIMECTARLSGGFDCQYTTPLATGRNFIKAALHLAIGRDIDPIDLEYKWHHYAVAWCGFPPPGKVISIKGINEALKIEGVKHVFLRVKEGETIKPYQDCVARPVFVIAVGQSKDEAIKNARDGLSVIKIETISGGEL